MNTETEIWKDVPGFEGEYQASNLGRVRSLGRTVALRNGRFRRIKARIRKTPLCSSGYPFVTLRQNVVVRVHRLVMCAFSGLPLSHPFQVDHIDGCRSNNAIENLRWATQQENSRNLHAYWGTSGTIGVSFSKREAELGQAAWYAYGTIDGKMRSLGHYPTKEEAVIARKKFEADNNWRPTP